HGAIFVLFLNPDGTVKKHQKISQTAGGFTGVLYPGNRFGTSLVSPGDLDGDGVNDLVAGAIYDQESYYLGGAVYVLFLKPDGTVKSHVKITDGQGGFGGQLSPQVRFGYSACALGDLDLDGVPDLAVGSILDDGGGIERGAVWILFMNPDGTVKTERKISDVDGGFQGLVDDRDFLGHSVAALSDLNGDGIVELAVGAIADDDGGDSCGAVWVLFLDRDGTVKGHRKISHTEGGFAGGLDAHDRFGQSACFLGDLDGDGVVELAVGADHDDDGGMDQGAVWILSLDRSAWTDLGHGLGGEAGEPKLTAAGALRGGDPVTVTVSDAPSHAAVWFAAGAAALSAPLLGGTLVPDPSPPGFWLLYVTDAAGELTLPAVFPPGVPSGTPIWLQAWIADPTGPYGATATNAVRGVTP
ncbi:MAG: integrin alpha, partial [Planctomycetota bacterium JB042]